MTSQKEITLSAEQSRKLGELYAEMEVAYDIVARAINHTCSECPDNCCDSFFLHHTYAEWAYLWEGMRALPEDLRNRILARAKEYDQLSETMLAIRKRPAIMCPANVDGLCAIYTHRLLVCRLHGVPASITRPDGNTITFPGCFRCQEKTADTKNPPVMDRTVLFQQMVALEMDLLADRPQGLPKVKMTLAKMLVMGPPILP